MVRVNYKSLLAVNIIALSSVAAPTKPGADVSGTLELCTGPEVGVDCFDLPLTSGSDSSSCLAFTPTGALSHFFQSITGVVVPTGFFCMFFHFTVECTTTKERYCFARMQEDCLIENVARVEHGGKLRIRGAARFWSAADDFRLVRMNRGRAESHRDRHRNRIYGIRLYGKSYGYGYGLSAAYTALYGISSRTVTVPHPPVHVIADALETSRGCAQLVCPNPSHFSVAFTPQLPGRYPARAPEFARLGNSIAVPRSSTGADTRAGSAGATVKYVIRRGDGPCSVTRDVTFERQKYSKRVSWIVECKLVDKRENDRQPLKRVEGKGRKIKERKNRKKAQMRPRPFLRDARVPQRESRNAPENEWSGRYRHIGRGRGGSAEQWYTEFPGQSTDESKTSTTKLPRDGRLSNVHAIAFADRPRVQVEGFIPRKVKAQPLRKIGRTPCAPPRTEHHDAPRRALPMALRVGVSPRGISRLSAKAFSARPHPAHPPPIVHLIFRVRSCAGAPPPQRPRPRIPVPPCTLARQEAHRNHHDV
ncbi:hypothetical protein B0H11DRAFT_1941086 [Mycena galericulata]|nr:hypothetical protein B0H11DRAFT_1941086 [Mycena galericulata]